MSQENNYENFKKIFNNEFSRYEKNWPYNTPKSNWAKFVSMFWGIRIVRRMIGGRWLHSPYMSGQWLSINDNFPKDWLEKYEHEEW